jgi:hypothetical protein
MNTEENKNETLKQQLDILVVSCSVCGGKDIKHEEVEGRGLPPKGWVRKRGDRRLISWKGIWDVYTCNDCGNKVETLRRD